MILVVREVVQLGKGVFMKMLQTLNFCQSELARVGVCQSILCTLQLLLNLLQLDRAGLFLLGQNCAVEQLSGQSLRFREGNH